MSMSNALDTILASAIRSGNLSDLRNAVIRDSNLASLSFTYGYTIDMGSDGCWSKDCEKTLTIGKFLRDGIDKSGNRSYNFYLAKVG